MREKVGEEDNLHFFDFPQRYSLFMTSPNYPCSYSKPTPTTWVPPSSAPPQLIIYKNRNTQNSFKSSQQNIFE